MGDTTSGILVIDKEKGYTSFDVVARLRSILHIKKIGHTGTLDPDATGVLPVCIGKATKMCELITAYDKEYDAVMRLGVATDTEDISGNVIEEADVSGVTEEDVRKAVSSFIGEYMQTPPMYSAKRINGKHLYELAREGVTVERKPVRVNISDIEIKDMALPRVSMRIACSKGTYIRTLCKDIGQAMGIPACMEELRRTRSGSFTLADAVQIDDKELASHIIPIDRLFFEYPSATVCAKAEKKLINGNRLFYDEVKLSEKVSDNEMIRVYYRDDFAALYRMKGKELVLEKFFL